MKHKKVPRSQLLLVAFIPIIVCLLFAAFYFYKEQYVFCIAKNLPLCLQSKKYISSDGSYSFRYPDGFPLSVKTGKQMKEEYGYTDEFVEWVNFSEKFYPNAGGERLGSVMVYSHTLFQNIRQYVESKIGPYDIKPVLESTHIGGKEAICMSILNQPHSFNTPSYDCYFMHGTSLFFISFDYNDYYHKLPPTYYMDARQLILSTMHFWK